MTATDETFAPYAPLPVPFAVERADRGGAVLGASQAVTVERALRALTLDAARLTFEEGSKGSLAAGKLADLAVLDADPTTITPDEIRSLPVPMTIVGGRVVHESGPGLG